MKSITKEQQKELLKTTKVEWSPIGWRFTWIFERVNYAYVEKDLKKFPKSRGKVKLKEHFLKTVFFKKINLNLDVNKNHKF